MIISVRNRSNYFKFPQSFEEKSKLPGLTVQGESYSIKELVLQMSQGVIPQKSPSFFPSSSSHDDLDLELLNRSSAMTKRSLQAEITQDITTDYSIYQQHAETLKKAPKNQSQHDTIQTQTDKTDDLL